MILEAPDVGEFAKQEGVEREESLEQSSEEPQHILPVSPAPRTITTHSGGGEGGVTGGRRGPWGHGN